MSMRISKYLPIGGIGADAHMALPPSVPPPPPAPPNPSPIPQNRYLVAISLTASAALTGKWSLASVQTEGMGDILWQYDWGPGQIHQAIGPAILTPSMIALALGSTAKYFLPSFSVKERVEGGTLAMIGGGEAPVAISTPTYCIPLEDCQDISGIGFVAPTSVSFQNISTRWVGFNFGDMAAGLIGMAGDALSAAIISRFGGQFIPGSWDDQLLGGLASTGMMHVGNLLASLPPIPIVAGAAGSGPLLSGVGHALSWEGASATAGLVVLAPLVAWGAGWAGNKVGDTWGSDESDTGVVSDPPDSAGGNEPVLDTPSGASPGGSSAPDAGTPADSGQPDAGVGESDAGDMSGGVCEPDAGDTSGGVCEPDTGNASPGGDDTGSEEGGMGPDSGARPG